MNRWLESDDPHAPETPLHKVYSRRDLLNILGFGAKRVLEGESAEEVIRDEVRQMAGLPPEGFYHTPDGYVVYDDGHDITREKIINGDLPVKEDPDQQTALPDEGK